MNTTTIFIIGAILSVVAVGVAVFFYYKKRNLEKFFNQIHQEIKHVPKQRKNSFLLLMFKESLLTSKNKSNQGSFANKLQNPKYLEVQLVQMSHILKDSSKVQDKLMKKSLNLFNSYQAWEKTKLTQDKKEVQSKAS